MKKNEECEVVIVDQGISGEGIAKIDGIPVFVPFAITGEKVKIIIVHLKKEYAFGRLISVINPSPDRVKPYCIHFGRCGGCDLQHIKYEKQLEIKRQNVTNTIKKITGLNLSISEICHKSEFHYRNKLSLPFGKKGEKVVLGFYEKQSHSLVPLKDCPLHDDWVKKLIEVVTLWATENSISVYDEQTGKGLLRHLVARKLDTLSVTIVINGNELVKFSELYLKLENEFKSVALYVSPNRKKTNVILGDSVKLLAGKEIEQSLGQFKATVSPLSFLQVNKEVMQLLYDKAASFLNGNVLELYSGVGLLTAQIALRQENIQITSVEIVREATADAKKLMEKLKLSDRVNIVCDDALKFMATQSDGQLSKFNCALLDPPRKGCEQSILEGIQNAQIDKIVYISCNPATLARDLKLLNNYEVTDISLFDMFPNTCHIETLVSLVKKS